MPHEGRNGYLVNGIEYMRAAQGAISDKILISKFQFRSDPDAARRGEQTSLTTYVTEEKVHIYGYAPCSGGALHLASPVPPSVCVCMCVGVYVRVCAVGLRVCA